VNDRLRDDEYPRLVFGKRPNIIVRYFPDKLPIGHDSDGYRHVFIYLARSRSPMDVRVFILRHLELLNALGFWTIRVLFPRSLAAYMDAYWNAVHELLAKTLHASYCSAVAFAGDDALVSASVGHFAAQGAIYRRRVDEHDSLVAVSEGLPAWTDGIVDTGGIATGGSAVALADRKGNLYVSADTGRSWSRRASGIPPPSSVLIV
jgi:hypothetical protein